MIRVQEIEDMDIPQAINGLSRSLGIADRLRQLAVKANNLELVEVVTELRVELANSKNALADAVEELAKLKNENSELKQLKASYKELIKDDNGLFYSYDDSDKQHAFCPSCWLGDLPARNLLTKSHEHSNSFKYFCNQCDWSISLREGEPPPPPSYRSRAYW